MTKKRPQINQKIIKSLFRGNIWRRISRDKGQIRFIIKKIKDPKVDKDSKGILKDYLAIALVSLFEFFFRNLAHKVVDDSKNLKDKNVLASLISDVHGFHIRNPQISYGELLISVYDFSDPKIVNKLFSRLYGINFYKSIDIINNSDPLREIGRGKPIKIDWNDFYKLFNDRNRRIHELKQNRLSNWKITKLCDHMFNILDLSMSLSLPDVRESDIEYYELPLEKIKKQ